MVVLHISTAEEFLYVANKILSQKTKTTSPNLQSFRTGSNTSRTGFVQSLHHTVVDNSAIHTKILSNLIQNETLEYYHPVPLN